MKAMHLLAAGWMGLIACSDPGAKAGVVLETEEQKKLYAIGLAVAGNTIGSFKGEFTAEEVAFIKEGFADALLQGEPKVALETYGPQLNAYLQQRVAARAEREKTRGQAFLEKAAAEPGAVKTGSGLVYQELRAGTGSQPQPTDRVKVHYHGMLIDGTVFDSSVEKGEPIVHPLNQFIPGWSEGVAMMRVGGKARLVIPPDLAYGDQQAGQIPPGSILIFEVELLGIE
jgi:FKBP-type peptidyl-prolyl cis-trans isomerase